jgi:hypothetical protein
MKDAWAERNQEPKEKNSAGPVKRYVRLREPLWGAKRSAKRLSDAEFVSAMEDSAADGCSGPRTEISRWRINHCASNGGNLFIEPLIEKRGYLLPQIGGVAEPQEFVAQQGIGLVTVTIWVCGKVCKSRKLFERLQHLRRRLRGPHRMGRDRGGMRGRGGSARFGGAVRNERGSGELADFTPDGGLKPPLHCQGVARLRRRPLQEQGVTHAETFRRFGAGDAGVGGETVEMVEAIAGRPRR